MDHNLICYPNTQRQQWGSNKRCLHKVTKRNEERFTEITTLGKNKNKKNRKGWLPMISECKGDEET